MGPSCSRPPPIRKAPDESGTARAASKAAKVSDAMATITHSALIAFTPAGRSSLITVACL